MSFRKKIIKGKWNGSWIFDITLFGIRHRKTVKIPKSAVKHVYNRWYKEILSSDGDNKKKILLYDKIDEFLSWCKKTKVELRYKRYCFTLSLFKNFIKIKKLNNIKSFHIDDYIIWRKDNSFSKNSKQLSNTAINKDIVMISHFFNYCIERNYYAYNNPCLKKKLSELKREIRLTREQIIEMITLAENHLKTAIYLIIYSGLRPSEMFQLKWNSINFEKTRIELPAHITKTKKKREIDIPNILLDYLFSLKVNSNSEYVITYNNKPVKSIKTCWRSLREKLSFKLLCNGNKIHFYDLRHVYGQMLKDLGVPMADIQAQLGHNSINLTEKYYANQKSINVKDNINKIDTYFNYYKNPNEIAI